MRLVSPFAHHAVLQAAMILVANTSLASTRRGARDAKHYAVIDPKVPSQDRPPLLQPSKIPINSS
jgi:hypothetical protein